MSVSEILDPNREPKTVCGPKAESTFHQVTMNPSSVSPGENLYITVPKLSDGVLLVPGFLALRFDLTVAEPKYVNNRFRPGEILQDTNRFDLLKTYEDLYLLRADQETRFEQGLQTVYEQVTLNKTFTIAKDTDSIINESVNVPRRLMTGRLLLFVEKYTPGARDSERFVFPHITSVEVSIDGMPNKVHNITSGRKPSAGSERR